MKFCNLCAGPLALQIPEDDERERHVCQNCGHIHYINPKVIVGCLPTVGDRILMCKRAIEPRYGKWTLPAGFMENGETSAGGAARETWEEAAAKAIDLELYRIFDVPHISQVYLFYRCGIENNEFGFVISDLPFKYQVLLPANEKEVYFVRCWVRPEDISNLEP